MAAFTDITDFMPNGFRLRAGAGGGDPKNGLCFMETVALIAGEPISDEPRCASPAVTRFGVHLNDSLSDAERQRLLPLCWGAVGTRSTRNEPARIRVLGLAMCDVAEMILPRTKAKKVSVRADKAAIAAARAYWDDPTPERCRIAMEASKGCSSFATGYAVRVVDAANAAKTAGNARGRAAQNLNATGLAVHGITNAYRVAGDPKLSAKILDCALEALRDAIKAGPHSGLPDEEAVIERIDAVRDKLPVTVTV